MAANGPVRTAVWLGDGRLAVAGDGLSLVDTGSWRVRSVDPRADSVLLAGDVLLASGRAAGLAAYDVDGRERFHGLAGKDTFVAGVYAGRAYVGVAGVDPLEVLDLATGRVVGRRATLPWLLTAPASSWWD